MTREPEPDDPSVGDATCVLSEVISPTIEMTDRREQLLAYRRVPGLQAYLIVEQEWQSALTSSEAVPVPCPNTTPSLADVYDGVT